MKADLPSSTALLIGRSVLLAEASPSLRGLLAEGSAGWSRRLLDASEPAPWFEFILRHGWAQRCVFRLERLLLPGIILHYLVRKRCIEELARESVASGCEQVVILGAGLDTLGLRLSHATVFELDHPATQQIKRRVCPETLTLIEADLALQSPLEILQAHSKFNPRLATLFICEGLLMYFAPDRVKHLLGELSGFGAPGSRLILTFMEEREGMPLAFHNGRSAINWWLRIRSEPFLWGAPRERMAGFLEEAGWHLTTMSTPQQLKERYLRAFWEVPLAIGESVVLATRADAANEKIP